jgi:DNA-binding response OmpR family regulator
LKRLLLVEDDTTLANALVFAFESDGFSVSCARNISEAAEHFSAEVFDVVVLDVMLPDGSGYDLCRDIRETSSVPILFLTAKDEEDDTVKGFELGADDYVSKPFRVRELLSRLHAVLRRQPQAAGRREVPEEVLSSGDIQLRPREARVRKGDEALPLTAVEYRLLSLFMRNPGVVLSRNRIMEAIGDDEELFLEDNTLSVYIRRLREKIEDDPSRPRHIQTLRNLGYRWDD